jgi:cytochrome c553
MKRSILVLLIPLLVGCNYQNSKTQVPVAGSTSTVQTCATCHGVDGKNGKPGVPPLSGRTYDELVTAMERVRNAYSPQPLLGHNLTDDEIKKIATYFSNVH